MAIIGTDKSETLGGYIGADDTIMGLGGDDWLFGYDGNDTLVGGFGADRLYGGAGWDTASYADSMFAGVVVNLTNGHGYGGTAEGDYLVSIENVDGSSFVDVLIGDGQDNGFFGEGGDDTLVGNGGNDNLYGGDGNDFMQGDAGSDYLFGGAGIDTVDYGDATGAVTVGLYDHEAFENSILTDTIYGVENVWGSAYNDWLEGDDGANGLRGWDGNDTLIGRGGDDYLSGGNGNDVLLGGDGLDRLWGEAGDDLLYGGNGNDILDGGSGHDVLDGGAGDDTLEGGGSTGMLIGGAGNDTVDYSNWGAVTVSLGDPLPYWAGSPTVHETLVSVENLIGSPTQDVLIGNNDANVISGRAGMDVIVGGAGADTMYGGTDSDSYYVDNPGDIVWEYVGEGTHDYVTTSVSYTLPAGSEIETLQVLDETNKEPINLTGNEFNNIIFGSDFDNIINGGGGADNMWGGAGNDTYIVDNLGDWLFENFQWGFDDRVFTSVSYALAAGSEIEELRTINRFDVSNIDLVGNQFNNIIEGNDGQNTIVGGLGQDTLTGNGGGDVFVWNSTAETAPAGDQADVVTDFNPLQGDFLAVDRIDADGNATNGDQAFTFVGVVDFTGSNQFTGAGQIGYFTTATDTFILLNTVVNPGPGGIDFEEATIRLDGVHTPDASWFVL